MVSSTSKLPDFANKKLTSDERLVRPNTRDIHEHVQHRAILRHLPFLKMRAKQKILQFFCRKQSSVSALEKPFFVTTPIYYATSAPHIGHLHSSVLADAAARYQRLRGRNAFLSTGTDEHGKKVAAAAAAAASLIVHDSPTSPNDVLRFCDGVSGQYRAMNDAFSIDVGSFVRTTSRRHACVAGWLWRRLEASGAIYLGRHEGWYCQSDESFLPASQVTTRGAHLETRGSADGNSKLAIKFKLPQGVDKDSWMREHVSVESGHTVEWLSEESYLFRLSQFRKQLRELHSATALTPFVSPPSRAAQMRTLIEEETSNCGEGFWKDLSVSRKRERVPWALPAPHTGGKHSIYVWVDALANYLTASAEGAAWATHVDAEGASCRSEADACELTLRLPLDLNWQAAFPQWPADVHIVGKDILKFHVLLWPALLLGAGLPPPRTIVAHGHWTVEHTKMSKSLGNVVAPRSLLASKGGSLRSDAVRYFLLRESRLELDSDFNAQLVQQRCVKECSDTLGNLASRILNKLFMPLGATTLIPGLKLTLPWSRLRNAGLVLDKGVDNTVAESMLEPQLLPLSDAQIALLVQAASLRDAAERGYETLEPGPALEAIMVVLQEANRVYSDSAPWKVRPSEDDVAQWAAAVASGGLVNFKLRDSDHQLVSIVYTILEVLRVASILLQPAMPTTALKLLEALGLKQGLESDALTPTRKSLTSWASAVPCVAQPHHFSPNVKSSLILFPKPAFEGAGKENSGGATLSKKAARKAVSKGGGS